MKYRRPQIPQRRPIFVGCEGQSEGGYVALLQDFAKEQSLAVHLHLKILAPGAGDPLARVQKSIQEIEKLRRTRVAPEKRFILLDEDQALRDPERARAARQAAEANGIQLVWQSPCFEAFLLRHLPQQQTRRPPDCEASRRALCNLWPEYLKGMTRADLAGRIRWESIQLAAQVEPDLRMLLSELGFSL